MLDGLHPRSWQVMLFAAPALSVAYVLSSSNSKVAASLYLTAAFAGTAALVWAARGTRLLGWKLIATGFGCWAAGDLAWVLDNAFGVESANLTIQDTLYLAAYPFLIAGVVVLTLSPEADRATIVRQLIDSTLLFASGFCTLWILYGDYVAQAAANDALSVVYPTLDVLLLALTARFVFADARWPMSYRLLTAALVLITVADLIWRIDVATGVFTLSDWTNTLYLGGYLVAGAAALHPTANAVIGFDGSDWATRTEGVWRRFAVLACAGAVPGLVIFFGYRQVNSHTDQVVLAATALLLPLLALARGVDLVWTIRAAAQEIDSARQRADAIIGASPLPIIVLDRDGIVRVWNAAAAAISGYGSAETLGKVCPVFSCEEPELLSDLLQRAAQGETVRGVEEHCHSRAGEAIDIRVFTAGVNDDSGDVILMLEDVTRERQHQLELEKLAHHDPLTGLPNRLSVEEALTQLAEQDRAAAWVLLLAVDNFKSVNDTGGHSLGDDVLREVADLVRRELREEDFLGRLSGDVFAVILYDLAPHGAVEVGERVLEAASSFRLVMDGTTTDLTLSGGLAPISGRADADTGLERADDALFEAKRLGKNRLECWTDDLESESVIRRWSPLIKDALAENRIELYLQPIVPLQGAGPDTYEALCRLRLTDGTIVAAGDFIEAAEETALMPAIDRYMLETAAELIDTNRCDRIFVNLSPGGLNSIPLLRWLERTLATLPPQSLGVEITERAALARPRETAADLARLVDAGAIVAIDDFGLGFTSFHELATLPCHLVKIPAGLTRWSGVDPVADAIARSVTEVAHAYGKQVVIEGIETEAGDRHARSLGIEYGQGWHYGRPFPSRTPSLYAIAVASSRRADK